MKDRVSDEGASSENGEFPNGFVPVGQRISAESLAKCLGKSVKTVHRLNQRFQLPARTAGDLTLIDTDEWWAALPRKVYGKEAEESER